MNNLKMLKKAMLAYVSAVKFVWSAIAYPLSIVGKKLMNLRGYRVYGNSVQDGTPTPDNPVEIECVGDLVTDEASEYYGKYKIPVVARGRNLIPMFTFGTFTQSGVTFTNNKDGTITINGTPTGYAGTPVISLPKSSLEVLRNNACVLTGFYKASSSNVSMGIDAYLDSKLVKQYYINTYSTNYIKVDLRSLNFNKINLNVKRSNNDKLIDNVTVKPFLEVGTTMPTSFEPYIAPVTTNIFLDEPLRKVGGYADYVDFEKQKVVRNVEVLDDTGTKTIDESLGVINPPTEETVKLPAIPQFKGTTIYEVGTSIKPSGMEAKYC